MIPLMSAVLSLVLTGPARGAVPMHETAVRLSDAARRAGVARVAVLPLEARGGGAAADGAALADALTGEVVREGRVRVVERARLPAVMSERRLGSAGATAAVVPEERLAPADAVVTGSFSRRGGLLRASVRLVHAETGEVLAAAEEAFDWTPSADEPAGRTEPSDAAVSGAGSEPPELRDAPNDDACAGAPARVRAIAAGVWEIEARYWASELSKGFSPYAAAGDAGAGISDPALKARFSAAVKAWLERGFVPELSRAEFERMRRDDARASALAGRCGA